LLRRGASSNYQALVKTVAFLRVSAGEGREVYL